MVTQPSDMSDLQLDITLEHCFARHKDAPEPRRAVIHRVTMDVLAEQAKRRDDVLGLRTSAPTQVHAAKVASPS